jgi:hypothetical protein
VPTTGGLESPSERSFGGFPRDPRLVVRTRADPVQVPGSEVSGGYRVLRCNLTLSLSMCRTGLDSFRPVEDVDGSAHKQSCPAEPVRSDDPWPPSSLIAGDELIAMGCGWG